MIETSPDATAADVTAHRSDHAASRKKPSAESDDLSDVVDRVTYARAVELVLSAASEYFNSSANLADSNMDLARACLRLIKHKDAAVSRELDLIEALALLDGFGVKVLPLQVRMCADRAEMVQMALQAKTHTYKNLPRVSVDYGRILTSTSTCYGKLVSLNVTCEILKFV